jgi:hypothetical protein
MSAGAPNMRRRALLGAVYATGLCWCGLARADDSHYQDFVVGGRSICLGGAYTAISDDPSGVYYNPAGITGTRQGNAQVSTSLYGFERGSIGGKLGLPIPGVENLNIQFTDLIIIPASAGFVQPLGEKQRDGYYDHVYAVNVVVPSFRSYSASNEGVDTAGTMTAYRRRVTDRSLWAGAAYGYRFSPELQLGVSAFYILRSVVDVEEVNVSVPTTSSQQAFKAGTNDLSFINGNVMLGFGARYVLTVDDGVWFFGLMVRTPSLRVHTSGTMLFTRGRADPEAPDGQRAFFDRHSIPDVDSETAYGVSVRAGVAFVRTKRYTLAADVMLYGPVKYRLVNITDENVLPTLPFSPEVERRTTANFNIGGEFLVIREVSVSVGLFSDFTSAPPIPENPTKDYLPHINLMGLTGAIGYFGKYTLSRIGFMYSAGRGQGVIPVDDTERLLDRNQRFTRVDELTQSFFYVFVSSTFRY